MAGQFKFAAFVLALGVGATAFGTVQITEHFDDDPITRGWSGVANTTGSQNYGFSTGDVTGNAVNPPTGTATAGGEMGGSITRSSSPANFYGVDLGGSLDSNTDAFHVQGVINVHGNGGSGWYLGYSNGTASYGSGGDAANFLGVQMDDGRTPIPIAFTPGQGRDRNTSLSTVPADTTLPFSMDYDPTGNGGNGSMAFVMGAQSVTFTGFNNGDLNPFTKFGVMPVSANGGTATFAIDDLTFTAVSTVPEPASLGLLSLGALTALRRRRRS